MELRMVSFEGPTGSKIILTNTASSQPIHDSSIPRESHMPFPGLWLTLILPQCHCCAREMITLFIYNNNLSARFFRSSPR